MLGKEGAGIVHTEELTINQIENILINSQENIDDPDLNIIKYN